MARNFTLRKKLLVSAAALAAVCAAAVIVMPWVRTLYDPDMRDSFIKYVDGLGLWGHVMMFCLQLVQVVIAIIPGEPVELVAGALYGGLGGLVMCLLGCALASAAVFMIMRRLGQPLLRRLFKKRRLEEFGFLHDSRKLETVTFILFLIPGTPKDMLTYVAGTTDIPLGRFLAISLLARVPSVVSSTFIGDTALSGNWYATAAILIATLALGLAGIFLRERALAFCRRHSRRARSQGAKT